MTRLRELAGPVLAAGDLRVRASAVVLLLLAGFLAGLLLLQLPGFTSLLPVLAAVLLVGLVLGPGPGVAGALLLSAALFLADAPSYVAAGGGGLGGFLAVRGGSVLGLAAAAAGAGALARRLRDVDDRGLKTAGGAAAGALAAWLALGVLLLGGDRFGIELANLLIVVPLVLVIVAAATVVGAADDAEGRAFRARLHAALAAGLVLHLPLAALLGPVLLRGVGWDVQGAAALRLLPDVLAAGLVAAGLATALRGPSGLGSDPSDG